MRSAAIRWTLIIVGAAFVQSMMGGRIEALRGATNVSSVSAESVSERSNDGVYRVIGEVRPGVPSNYVRLTHSEGIIDIPTDYPQLGVVEVEVLIKGGFITIKSIN